MDAALPDAAASDATTSDGAGGIIPSDVVMLVGFQLADAYCGLKKSGELRCWADSAFIDGYLAPLAAKAPPDLVRIATADTVTADPLFCGVDSKGRGTCWGAATQIDLGGPLLAAALSRHGTCALHQDGRLQCVGISPLPADRRYTQIAAAADFMIGLDQAGTPVHALPSLVPPPGTFRRVAMFGSEGAALRDDGAIVHLTWPEHRVMSGPFVDLSFGARGLCGLDANGEVRCFSVFAGTSPLPPPPAGPFRQIASGHQSMCGLGRDGTICWGEIAVSVPPGW